MDNNMQTKIQVKIDQHRGLHLYLLQVISPQELQPYLHNQINLQMQLGSVWIHFQTNNVLILDLLVNKLNYKIHHALGKDIVVYQWRRQDQDLVVPYSIFWIAAGAVVIRDNKILLVQQKNGARKGKYGLPGGRANRNELIGQCAQRQLFQQTGIKAKFSRVLFFRQMSKNQLDNCVDSYFVCLMELTETSLDSFSLCKRELSGHEWVELSEYHEFCNKHSIGTQIATSHHISKLYLQGKLFRESTYQTEMNLEKGLCIHRL